MKQCQACPGMLDENGKVQLELLSLLISTPTFKSKPAKYAQTTPGFNSESVNAVASHFKHYFLLIRIASYS